MERVKTILLFVLSFGIVGEVVASFFAPKFIVWYNTPGAGVGDAICNPGLIINDTISAYVNWQLIGAGVGALAGLVVGALVVAKRKKLEAEKQQPPTTPTATTSG